MEFKNKYYFYALNLQTMIKRKLNLIIPFLLLTIFLMVSCAKSKENKLIGKWKQIDYNNLNSTDSITWEFKADGTLWISNDTAYTDTAVYDFQSHSMRYYVQISGLGTSKSDDDWDGLYHIDKLTNDVLMLQCQDPFLRWEFMK